jgi:predicted outer membrane protein
MSKFTFASVLALVAMTSFALAQQAAPRSAAPGQPAQGQVQAQPGQQSGQRLGAQGQQQNQQRFGQQNQVQQGQRITANRPVDGRMNPDMIVAQWLGLANAEEIALANLATQRSQNDKVKQFAQTLVKDHTDLLNNLHNFGAQVVRLDAGAAGQDQQGVAGANQNQNQNQRRDAAAGRDNPRDVAQNQPGRPAADTRTARPEGQAGAAEGAQHGMPDFFHVKQQIAQRCLAEAQRCWSEHRGNEADMSFVGTQIVLHEQMLATAQTLREYASPELQNVIDKGIQGTQMHLDHAKNLIRTLDQQAGNSDSKSDKNEKKTSDDNQNK